MTRRGVTKGSKAKRPTKAPSRSNKPASRAKRVAPSAAWAREPGLEAAIIAAPLDPMPRMVYADWLQAAGDRRGEWMALHSAIEREPSNLRLRSLAVEFLGKHHKLLLGGGSALLPGGWIGWRGGFVDEIRMQPFDAQRNAVTALAELLAHPSSRFVRCVGIGEVKRLQETVDALVAAAPPLLETVVVCDAPSSYTTIEIDGIARLSSVRRLGLLDATCTTPMPQLTELAFRIGANCETWVGEGGCPNVERLSIDCRGTQSPAGWLARILTGVPKLRWLRLLHLREADVVVEQLRRYEGQLEYLDLSHSNLTAAGAEQLRGPNLHVVAMRGGFGAVQQLEKRVASVVTSPFDGRIDGTISDDHGETGGWLHYMLATGGRDALIAMPGIGQALFSVGTHHSMYGKETDAIPLLDASLTFPTEEVKTWPWANAAIAHERAMELDEAELIAREGLLRTPKEPNLYAIIVDAVRRTGRLAQAEALLPKALATITAPRGPGAHVGGPAACLADCLLVLAQVGRHEEVVELADEHGGLLVLRPHIYATVAMSLVALGRVAEARAVMRKAKAERAPSLIAHARAVMALAGRSPQIDKAIAALAEAKAEPYPEWRWIATDPNLAKLADVPAFQALIAPPA